MKTPEGRGQLIRRDLTEDGELRDQFNLDEDPRGSTELLLEKSKTTEAAQIDMAVQEAIDDEYQRILRRLEIMEQTATEKRNAIEYELELALTPLLNTYLDQHRAILDDPEIQLLLKKLWLAKEYRKKMREVEITVSEKVRHTRKKRVIKKLFGFIPYPGTVVEEYYTYEDRIDTDRQHFEIPLPEPSLTAARTLDAHLQGGNCFSCAIKSENVASILEMPEAERMMFLQKTAAQYFTNWVVPENLEHPLERDYKELSRKQSTLSMGDTDLEVRVRSLPNDQIEILLFIYFERWWEDAKTNDISSIYQLESLDELRDKLIRLIEGKV